ncbi:MAG: sigma 54-interacting transcriptional regulator [Candidatus Cloacimonetes bacterium]|nr:sigma 54-interacting transcriptional regulator [Candidatus Cloacimonadota bacterium]MCF7815004.1 sigma 54-interacting transcriptional regulator [Candidatus Cloacimonadota bacterium]MCF7869247.1 sigma 54-interacting transcriptional regulator [Candidatus Cloacimonadota bacterium]MCF7884681.1 sigma 54-interacting transcriptional regulator [Candidatus Cloacimonadota bacterium]
MNDKVEELLSNLITEDLSLIHNIIDKLQSEKSKIIEVVGESGSGKSIIFRKLLENLPKADIDFKYYIPARFRFNHFWDIVQYIVDISREEFDTLIQDAEQFDIIRKYDFFYYITEKLTEKKLFKPQNIIIYEIRSLDQYCLDFIQYLVNYSEKIPIQFVVFSQNQTIPFSEKMEIATPSEEDIRQILLKLYPNNKEEFYSESEILNNISKNNLGILTHILSSVTENKKKLDLSAFLDKKVQIEKIYKTQFDGLSEKQQQILFRILLLDTLSNKEKLKNIYGKTAFTKDLNELVKQRLIMDLDGRYMTKKGHLAKEIFLKFPDKKQREIYEPILDLMSEESRNDLLASINVLDSKSLNKIINRVKDLRDYKVVIKLYNFLLELSKDSNDKVMILTSLGDANRNLSNYENAAEYYRRALKICADKSLPADDIVYKLAKCLNNVGSSAFALEILKKYTHDSKNEYLKCKVVLLKAEILIEMEDFDEALESTSEASHLADHLRDAILRLKIKAEAKKIRGKIYYYSNDWSKAEQEFVDSEKLFMKLDDKEGLAAIYNNLGILELFHGDINSAEILYMKSLQHEQDRYNLLGISVCYSNLGYLFDDRSDYKKALHYLNEALKIQKLLNDRNSMTFIYINIGVTYMDNGKYKKADEAFHKSLEIAIEFNLYKNVIAAYNNLGALYFRSGDFTKAIDYYEQAIKRAKEYNFSEGMCQSYNNLGELFEKRGEFNLAFDFYSKAKELLPMIADEFIKAELYGNLGSVLTQLHKFKEAYAYLVESFDYFKGIEHRDKILEGAQNHAIYFILTRNLESANYYLDQALKIAEESENDFQIGKGYYIKALIDKEDIDLALEHLKKATEKFVKTNSDFELTLANYEYAALLLEKEDWEQALQILTDNRKLIRKFEAIKFLEKNDVLIQKINTKYEKELKESKHQESLLNKFYEITQHLNAITDFDVLLEAALDQLVDFAEADGGVFALYNNKLVKDSWEYLILNNFSNQDNDFPKVMDVVQSTFSEAKSQNHKQPHFAPKFNNIISYPLSVRNDHKGVICLFTKRSSHYFTEKMYNLISALCNQIVVIVENISYQNLQKTNEGIREELAASSTFTNIIGKSEKIQEIFRMVEKIKNAPTTVLLEGSSGTGKELIARAIHYNSNRRNKQFVAQYCGALPETLLESELFGHAKGSFTGATHDKKGLFEVADGGTFFLDEIADISLSTQAKLLRFLQEGEIKRVGSTITQKVDVRVICATNVSLRDKVEKGEFRLDLFYRLNVIRIEVPSLAQRKSDIPLLAVHFLDKYCRRLDKNVKGITEEAMKYLMNYDWPGNIRQLENEIERAVTLSEPDSSIRSADLSEEIFRFQDNQETVNLLEKRSLKDAVEDLEKQMIVNVLNEVDWNQTQAAKKLGLSRQGLIKKLQRYKLER